MNRLGIWGVLGVLLLAGCDTTQTQVEANPDVLLDVEDIALQDTTPAPDSGETDTVPDTTQPSGPRQVPPPLSVEQPARLVAIGDVHGDIGALRETLKVAGAIDDNDTWIGGELVVVQVGDQLDRGDDEEEILLLLEDLADQAHAAGGALYILLGNHETMNVDLDFRYVTEGGWADFAEYAETAPPDDPQLAGYPERERGRVAAFRPGGPYARVLAEHNVVMIVGDTLFVHGGILPTHMSYDLGSINAETQAWMRGERSMPEVLSSSESPVWSRHYSRDTTLADCALLEEVLTAAGLSRMVVAHSVQDQGINAGCDGLVWRIDVGLADYYGGPRQIFEIAGEGQISILQ